MSQVSAEGGFSSASAQFESPVPVSYARAGLGRPATAPRLEDVSVAFIFFCILIPFGSNFFEITLQMCSGMIFDPFPTLWHALLAASVPIINAVAYARTRYRSDTSRAGLRVACGLAIGASIYFTIMFAPLMPFAVPGILVLGLGLLVFGPMLGLIGACICLRRVFARSAPLMQDNPERPARRGYATAGFALAMILLVGPEFRRWYTEHHLSTAVAAVSDQQRADAIRSLRTWGDDRIVLNASYGDRGRRDFASGGGWDLLSLRRTLATGDSGKVYYRMTGMTPDEATVGGERETWRGSPYAGRQQDWQESDQEWDLRGSAVVGQPIRALSLANSSMVGTIHGDAATGYVEWILEFDNQSLEQQEARCRIALPPESVVSRVTLWINGEEREAAYGGAAKVREAYQSVAVVQRRDPVLVTGAGPGHVMLQCFPVPPKGRMQTKIGVTLPLQLMSASQGRFSLPYIVERNFNVSDGKTGGLHLVSLDAGQPLKIAPAREGMVAADAFRTATTTYAEGKNWQTLSGRLTDKALTSRTIFFTADRRPERTVVWGPDPFGDNGNVVVQTIEEGSHPKQSRVSLAIDASAAMEPVWAELCDAVAALPAEVRIDLHVAADLLTSTTNLTPADAAAVLRDVEPEGGQDPVPAIVAAAASADAEGLLIWIHGPQAMELSVPAKAWAAIHSKIEMTALNIEAVTGANPIARELTARTQMLTPPWEGSLRATLATIADDFVTAKPSIYAHRRIAKAAPADAVKSNIDLARLRAKQYVYFLLRDCAGAEDEEATRELAASNAIAYRLVTDVSGAVVLETQGQYEEHGLSPVSVVPLPPAVWAALITLPILIIAKRRMMRRAA